MVEGGIKEITPAEHKYNAFTTKAGDLVDRLNELCKEYGVEDVRNSVLIDSQTPEFRLMLRYDTLMAWFS